MKIKRDFETWIAYCSKTTEFLFKDSSKKFLSLNCFDFTLKPSFHLIQTFIYLFLKIWMKEFFENELLFIFPRGWFETLLFCILISKGNKIKYICKLSKDFYFIWIYSFGWWHSDFWKNLSWKRKLSLRLKTLFI